MEDVVRLRQLVASLESRRGTRDAVKESIDYLRSLQGRGEDGSSAHSRLCAAFLRGWEGSDGEQESFRELLHLMGPAEALTVVYDNIGGILLPAARWLSNEVHQIPFSQLLYSQCRLPKIPRLTPNGDRLVGTICRLPGVIANRLGHHLDPTLLPQPYFTAIGQAVLGCLELIYQSFRASEDCSLAFPATVIGKAAILGQKAAILSKMVPPLEQRAVSDPLWRRVTHTLFSSIPTNCLESVLDALLLYTSPSLQPPFPLYSMLGELAVTNQKAGFLLTHKLFLVKVPASPHAVFTLIGYLSASDALRRLMGKSLQSLLGVWSDASALRHMDTRQHMWITQLVILGMTCLRESELERLKPVLQQLVMSGIQVHIDSPVEMVRHVGMATGECLMNRLNPSTSHKLKFEYDPSDEVKTLLNLARPVAEQDAELKLSLKKEEPQEEGECLPSPVRYGEGMVQTMECSDTDSDDDLVPYAMGDDPSSSQPTPPRYLRTLQQALLSSRDPLEQEAALSIAESLIRSRPHDLNEVCVELVKVLLHLSDTFVLTNFIELRHKGLVALAVTCPTPVAQYLTAEFYAPNYNLRQRMDILEVLSTAAMELSNPASASSVSMVTTKALRASSKPWEEVISERLKAKTRIISKGPSKAPPTATPNQFAPVASLFFFPLMARFDSTVNTLDLLGQDSLVLGNLLYTLGTIMHCATHAPVATAMAKALMNFIWTFRYHPSTYVRQGALYALGMAITSTPLFTEMEGALIEAGHWARDVCVNDADDQSRALAKHVLALMDTALKEV